MPKTIEGSWPNLYMSSFSMNQINMLKVRKCKKKIETYEKSYDLSTNHVQ
jgi:hypothetical protein